LTSSADAATLPDNPALALRDIGRKFFAPLMERPEARALWWPRFQRIAHWFAGWETRRRALAKTLKAETSGQIEIPLGERVFTLRGRADRIEELRAGPGGTLDAGAVPGTNGAGATSQGPMHDILIEELELGVRSYNCLKRAGIQTVGDLVSKTEGELNAIPNFGKKSIDEVIETLHARGLDLRND